MKNVNVRNFLVGAALVGGMSLGVAGCAGKNDKKSEKEGKKIENVQSVELSIPEKNEQLFESCRSEIKFALCFVENDFPYVYFCGKAWTTGGGLTVLYDKNGNSTKVTRDTKVPKSKERDVYKGRYMTIEILSDIKKLVKVPLDEKTLLATCVFRYCIGHNGFVKSKFLKKLNAGITGPELIKTLTGYRKDKGVLKRCYFFAALMEDKIAFSDLLDLRCEGCYKLEIEDVVVCKDGVPVADKENFLKWDYSKLEQNLEKAKEERTTKLHTNNGKVNFECKLVKETVQPYIWDDVTTHIAEKNKAQDEKQDTQPEEKPIVWPWVVLAVMGTTTATAGAGYATYQRIRHVRQHQRVR